MRPLFEPALLNDSFGDPGLYVDFRDERRALLFDFGDLGRLPPRKLLRLSQVFVSHTHMDHFAGFDQWLRVVLGRKERITLTGGPGFIDRVGHKLARLHLERRAPLRGAADDRGARARPGRRAAGARSSAASRASSAPTTRRGRHG